MALQFVPGNSGAGKSFQLYQKILQEAGTHPERKYLVIVPEQFTMQTQKELVALSPRHGIMNVDILSFDRLAHRVFAEVGGDQTPVLEDVGKILVLERVVQEQKKKLGVLGSSLEKLGTVSELFSRNVPEQRILRLHLPACSGKFLRCKHLFLRSTYSQHQPGC